MLLFSSTNASSENNQALHVHVGITERDQANEELKSLLQDIRCNICFKRSRDPVKERQDILSLLSRKANVQTRNHESDTALHLAAWSCNIPLVKALLENSADPYAVDTNGATPLHLAINQEFTFVSQILLAHGTDAANIPNKFGNTPLHIAANNGNLKHLKLLIQYSANLNQKGFGPDETAMLQMLSKVILSVMTVNQQRRDIAPPSVYIECMKLLADNGATFANEFLHKIKTRYEKSQKSIFIEIVNVFKEVASSIQSKGYTTVNSPEFRKDVQNFNEVYTTEAVKKLNKEYRQTLKKTCKKLQMLLQRKLKMGLISEDAKKDIFKL